MLRSHSRPSVGDWVFIYSKSCNICMSGFDSPPHIESRHFIIGLCLVKNNITQLRSSFVHFWGREAYSLVPTNALVTWQPQEPIKLPSCDLATRTANHSVLLWPCSHGMAQQLVQPWSLASNHLSRRLFLLVCGSQRIDWNCRGCLSL